MVGFLAGLLLVTLAQTAFTHLVCRYVTSPFLVLPVVWFSAMIAYFTFVWTDDSMPQWTYLGGLGVLFIWACIQVGLEGIRAEAERSAAADAEGRNGPR
jgi:hypothetical protein